MFRQASLKNIQHFDVPGENTNLFLPALDEHLEIVHYLRRERKTHHPPRFRDVAEDDRVRPGEVFRVDVEEPFGGERLADGARFFELDDVKLRVAELREDVAFLMADHEMGSETVLEFGEAAGALVIVDVTFGGEPSHRRIVSRSELILTGPINSVEA